MAHKQNALDAFLARKSEIDTALERLQALSNDHFNAHPDEINWGARWRPGPLRRTPQTNH